MDILLVNWWDFVNMAMNIRVHKSREICSSVECLLSRILLHGVI
jgi:hypothetical protein